MHGRRDFCWLAKQVQNRKIFTYYMEDMENTAIAETIERGCHAAVRGSTALANGRRPPSSFRERLDEKLGQEGYRIEDGKRLCGGERGSFGRLATACTGCTGF